ncbi:MAG: CPBP family intramembrane metalloprotease [Chitinophagaceae bacterium]|nr:CPBP family intramembrane metalloprotease [Chitinophagaceae bacterium]
MSPFHIFSKYFICYGLFFLLTYITKLNDGLKLIDEKGIVRNPGILVGLHIAGILWLGIVASNILNYSFFSIVFGSRSPEPAQWIVLLVLLIIAITTSHAHANSFRFKNTNDYSGNTLTYSFLRKYFIIRILFLIAYEAWFRGYLLADSIQHFGTIPAVLINVVLYAQLHIFSRKKELIASIPFGILLCGLSTWFDAAWPAIILHLTISLTYEITLVSKIKIINQEHTRGLLTGKTGL